jgi:hypothetical protein
MAMKRNAAAVRKVALPDRIEAARRNTAALHRLDP